MADSSVAFPTDPLSNAAREVLRVDVQTSYTSLVPTRPGSEAARGVLSSLDPASTFRVFPRDPTMAAAVLSGLWLWHDFLDESHTLSQGIQTPSGSFWHAIMHRREGDFSNAKYWYARCAAHPVLASLAIKADDVLKPFPADKSLLRLTAHGWNANGFVDLVEAVHDRPDDPRHRVAVLLQQLEWRTLLDFCTAAAAG
jgi:hypothetical protein